MFAIFSSEIFISRTITGDPLYKINFRDCQVIWQHLRYKLQEIRSWNKLIWILHHTFVLFCPLSLPLNVMKLNTGRKNSLKSKYSDIYSRKIQILAKRVWYLCHLDSIPLTSLLFCTQDKKIDKMSNYHNLSTLAYKTLNCSFMQLIEWVCPSITTNTEKMLDLQFGHLMPQENRDNSEKISLSRYCSNRLLELPTLLECVIQDFLTSSHKNKARQNFKVLF